MGAIRTFEDRHPGRDLLEVAARNPSSLGDRTLPAMTVSVSAPALEARVNVSRWIADCPDPTCGGAEYVSFETPVFFCCECRNAAAGNELLGVLLPDPARRAQVEAYLAARPDERTRNWVQQEPVLGLRDENRANGIKLPKG